MTLFKSFIRWRHLQASAGRLISLGWPRSRHTCRLPIRGRPPPMTCSCRKISRKRGLEIHDRHRRYRLGPVRRSAASSAVAPAQIVENLADETRYRPARAPRTRKAGRQRRSRPPQFFAATSDAATRHGRPSSWPVAKPTPGPRWRQVSAEEYRYIGAGDDSGAHIELYRRHLTWPHTRPPAIEACAGSSSAPAACRPIHRARRSSQSIGRRSRAADGWRLIAGCLRG